MEIKAKALCIILRDDKEVLATVGQDKDKNEEFGRILGGTIEFGEDSKTALKREFLEEVGSELQNIQFLKVVENIFTFNGVAGHQITFLYKADLADKSLYSKEKIKILDNDASAVWIPLEKMKNGFKVYPLQAFSEIYSIPKS